MLYQLKTNIVSVNTIERLYPFQWFYINTEWQNSVMVVVLLQEDESVEAINSDEQEKDGGKCKFDNSLEGIRLRPISFISRLNVSPLEKSRILWEGGVPQ